MVAVLPCFALALSLHPLDRVEAEYVEAGGEDGGRGLGAAADYSSPRGKEHKCCEESAVLWLRDPVKFAGSGSKVNPNLDPYLSKFLQKLSQESYRKSKKYWSRKTYLKDL